MKSHRKLKFPHDKRITVIKGDLSEYKTWQSDHLMIVHKWTESEVRVQQSQQLEQ